MACATTQVSRLFERTASHPYAAAVIKAAGQSGIRCTSMNATATPQKLSGVYVPNGTLRNDSFTRYRCRKPRQNISSSSGTTITSRKNLAASTLQ